MSKNTIIVLGVVIVLIIGGIIVFSFLQKGKIAPEEEPVSEEGFLEESGEESGETISLSATVLSIDIENSFLIVKPENQEKEIKVIIKEETKMIKLGLPTDPEDLPKEGGVFTPTEEKINISDFHEGDKLFIKTTTNLVDKTELDDVELIQILS
ncbi:MAG: hypothetical protein ISS83_01430 [Candidatus Pacebacteria bacterium]|nr:hypothetical protein [Candidatus Paceibacterota bacterium]